ncbi:hypothetical protein GQ457_05G026420 [Hibiscus cannabinus]
MSLVGCIYKLLSKVLAIRLRNQKVLNEVLGEHQFDFFPGKRMLDCLLIANEVVEFSRRKGLEGVVFKADFSKACDTVDCDFLMVIMKKMGFRDVRCHSILCISLAYISVLINGSPTSLFAIMRGLRQGCPLSPLLFNIIAEALSTLIQQENAKGLFKGFLVGQATFKISHIQFADDLIMFYGAGESQIKNIVRILREFELASRLKLNLKKSKLVGINVDEKKTDYWATLLHCQSEKIPCQYLGLPLGVKRNSTSIWEPTLKKFKTKIMS